MLTAEQQAEVAAASRAELARLDTQAPQAPGNGGVHRQAGPGLDPDDPDAEREPQESTGAAPAIAESLPAFLVRVRQMPEPGWLVRELIPDEGVCVGHGRPRSMKSLTAEDTMLSLALGEPYALGNQRFGINHAVGVLWLGEEDSERLDAFRFGLMLNARGILPGQEPDTFRLVVRPGWDLESPSGQAELMATIRDTAAVMAAPLLVLVIDPVRASMPSIDGGPKDAARARAFLLAILRETTVRVILLPHHDLKPARDGKDDRSRAERASGGVTFSMGDCMVNFERLNDRECLAVPTNYKLGSDPKPFKVRFESETPSGEGFRGFLRAVAETTDEATDTRARVLAFVKANPWSATSEVDKGAKVGTGEAASYLAQLEVAGLVVSVTGAEAQAKGLLQRLPVGPPVSRLSRLSCVSPALQERRGDYGRRLSSPVGRETDETVSMFDGPGVRLSSLPRETTP